MDNLRELVRTGDADGTCARVEQLLSGTSGKVIRGLTRLMR